MYDNYEEFIRTAIERFYEQVGRKNPASFVALLVASGETVAAAYRSVNKLPLIAKIAGSVVGAVALRAGLKLALSGPLGWIVSAATVASLVRYFVVHHKDIMGQIASMRSIIDENHIRYEEIQRGSKEGRYNEEEKRLMVDGLMQRLMRDLMEARANQGAKA